MKFVRKRLAEVIIFRQASVAQFLDKSSVINNQYASETQVADTIIDNKVIH